MRQADTPYTTFLSVPLFCILICGLLVPSIQAAEQAQDDASSKIEAPIADAVDFSDLESCSQIDGIWYWSASDQLKVRLVGRSGSYIKAASPIGTVRIKKNLFVVDPHEYITAWFQILDHAKGLGADDPERSSAFIFGDSNITGPRLSSKKAVVLRHVALIKSNIDKPDFSVHIAQIKKATEILSQGLSAIQKLDDLDQKSIENILTRLSWKDQDESKHDAVPPNFARRVVRNLWLQETLGPSAAVESVTQAVIHADSLQLIQEYAAGEESLKRLSNAFGDTVWLLVTKDLNVYARKASAPTYHRAADDIQRRIQCITFLKQGIDPLTQKIRSQDVEKVILENKRSREILASWNKTDGFHSEQAVWRGYISSNSTDIVDQYVPPHITQTDLQGDIIQIITPFGSLAALDKKDETDSERFLAQAAKVLPNAPYLDLIGQYMMTYVYDSPDSSQPYLIGTSDISSDIHQTALQTLSTSCGGQFRGDCDDLSELYHNILVRQNKLPHVVSLPGHAAVAWAEKKSDRWHSYVLQTGPALEFVDTTLQNSLQSAYKHFDENDTFDPNGLGLLLRFSGENTRSAWRLSYRIFSEAEYAHTMIDVQRDWHFQTYQRAIHKMLQLIADGDEDTANYRELSGLYRSTGQYDKAAEYQKESIERTTEADSKLYMTMEYVQHLMSGGYKKEGLAAAQDIYDRQLPEVKEKLGGAEIQFALQMAMSLMHQESYDLALDFLSTYMQPTVSQTTDKINAWLRSANFNADTWRNSGQLRQLRRILKMYVSATLGILKKRGIADIHSNKTVRSHFNLVQHWINTVGPYETDEMDDVLNAYTLVGNFYLTHMDIGTLLTEIDRQEFPQSTEYDHTTRISAAPQFAVDMQWVKLSVPFWFGQISTLFDLESDKADLATVNNYVKHAEAAFAQCEKLEIASAFTQKQIHYIRVIHALMNEDENSLRQLLTHVKEKNDKRLRDTTAQWMGDCARSLSLEWFKKVTQIWVEELDYKPKYYWIAWRAALNKAPQHALHIASIAAERFNDDPAFVEEYEFMKVLFAEQAKQKE